MLQIIIIKLKDNQKLNMFRTLFTSAVLIAAISTQASAIDIQDKEAAKAAAALIAKGNNQRAEDAGFTGDFSKAKDLGVKGIVNYLDEDELTSDAERAKKYSNKVDAPKLERHVRDMAADVEASREH